MLSPERLAEIQARIDAFPNNLDSQTRFVYRTLQCVREHGLRHGLLVCGKADDDWPCADIWANSSRDIRDLLDDLRAVKESLARFESNDPDLGDLSFREVLRSALITKLLEENKELAHEISLLREGKPSGLQERKPASGCCVVSARSSRTTRLSVITDSSKRLPNLSNLAALPGKNVISLWITFLIGPSARSIRRSAG